MIHIDRKVFSKLRAGRVDRMLNEHYLAQLTAEHQLLASMRRVEECSELAQSIEDFALDNELDVPKLATTEELGGFRVTGTVVKAAVKMKRRARRASVEIMEQKKLEKVRKEEEKALEEHDEEEEMLKEMRRTRSGEPDDAEKDKVAKSLAANRQRGRRASVDLSGEGLFQTQSDVVESKEKKRYQGRRRSVSEWDTSGADAANPFADPDAVKSPPDSPVPSPAKGLDKTTSSAPRLERTRSKSGSSPKSGRERTSSKSSSGGGDRGRKSSKKVSCPYPLSSCLRWLRCRLLRPSRLLSLSRPLGMLFWRPTRMTTGGERREDVAQALSKANPTPPRSSARHACWRSI